MLFRPAAPEFLPLHLLIRKIAFAILTASITLLVDLINPTPASRLSLAASISAINVVPTLPSSMQSYPHLHSLPLLCEQLLRMRQCHLFTLHTAVLHLNVLSRTHVKSTWRYAAHVVCLRIIRKRYIVTTLGIRWNLHMLSIIMEWRRYHKQLCKVDR